MADDVTGIDHVSIEYGGRTVEMSAEELSAAASGDAPAPGLLRDMAADLYDRNRRVVEVEIAGEDFRALIGRCLLFAATSDERTSLEAIHLTVSPYWITAAAADGYILGIQKIRCSSEAGGTFLLPAYDAQRMLRMVPKPSKSHSAISQPWYKI